MAYVAGPLAEMSCISPATYTPPALGDCGRQLTRNEAVPNRPTNFSATTQSGYKVLFQWDHVSLSGDTYRLEAYEGGVWGVVQDNITEKQFQRVWEPRQAALHRVRTKRSGLLSLPSDSTLGRTLARVLFQGEGGGPGVVDAQNNPIAGAEVIVYDVLSKAILARGTTDAQGKAVFNDIEWPRLVMATADPMRDTNNVELFTDDFQTLSGSWVQLEGSGSLSVVDDANARNGKALRVSGYAVLEHSENIAIDEEALYRIRVAVRQVSDPTSGGKQLFLGVSGVAANGTTRINTTGEDSYSSQHSFAASGDTLGVSDTFTEFVGYFWYGGTPAGAKSPTRSTPGLLFCQVAYIRPWLVVNASSGNGVVHVDYVVIEKLGTNENPAEAWHHLVV